MHSHTYLYIALLLSKFFYKCDKIQSKDGTNYDWTRWFLSYYYQDFWTDVISQCVSGPKNCHAGGYQGYPTGGGV